MTKLMISVTDAAEARRALNGGADLIDVKNPRNGPLGPAEPEVWRAVRAEIGPQIPLGVALGELLFDQVQRIAPETGCADYFKIGLAGCRRDAHWRKKWRQAAARAPSRSVAVYYADEEAAQSPSLEDVLALASAEKCAAFLVDTWSKERSLPEILTAVQLRRLAGRVRKLQIPLVLAGGLSRHDAQQAATLVAVEIVAVRGAVCPGGRAFAVEESLVAELALRLKKGVNRLAPAN